MFYMEENVIEDFNPDVEAFNFDEINPMEENEAVNSAPMPVQPERRKQKKELKFDEAETQVQQRQSRCLFMCCDDALYDFFNVLALVKHCSVSSILRPLAEDYMKGHKKDIPARAWEAYNQFYKKNKKSGRCK